MFVCSALAAADGLTWLLPGLALAICAWLGQRYLETRADILDHEMLVACHDLAAWLAALRQD
jgi:hypothetical protein